MKELGKVIHVSRTGLLVLKAVNVPKIGAKAFDESSKVAGVVIDVFGSVSSPYVAIRPHRYPEKYVGGSLYV